MARTVYSSQIWAVVLTESAPVSFTFPDGYRTVIRDISGTVFGAGDAGAELLVVLDPSGLTVVHSRFPPGSTVGYHWQGHIVVEPGSGMTVSNAAAAETDLVFSGYLLTLP